VSVADMRRNQLEGLNSNARARGAMFTPNLQFLQAAQRRLWDELRHTPREFVLYGGTALALRLGHRHSEVFDFFSNKAFAPDVLLKAIPYLQGAELSQVDTNTLTAIVDRGGPVKVSFFGELKLNRVREPEVAQDNGIQVASLLDVAATKLATIQQRAQTRGLRGPRCDCRLRDQFGRSSRVSCCGLRKRIQWGAQPESAHILCGW
jgi:hypothetical protein